MRRATTVDIRLAATIAIAGVLLAGILTATVWLSRYPARQAAELRRSLRNSQGATLDGRIQLEIALLQYETDNRVKIWTAIVQAAGGTALLVGLLFTARNLRATQDKLDIDRQGQLTSRFIQATAQLGAELKGGQPNIEVRLGGIYALNRIAKDWPKDYWPIADVLTAYVRHNARWRASSGADPVEPSTDVQAVLTVLAHSDPPGGFTRRNKLDLRKTDLRGAEFWDAHMEYTDFWGAHLDGAQMWGALFRNAKFDNARLNGANLRAANLEGASLEGADVAGATFDRHTVWPEGFDARAAGAVFVDG